MSGLSFESHRKAALAIVTMPVMGCLISWAIAAETSPAVAIIPESAAADTIVQQVDFAKVKSSGIGYRGVPHKNETLFSLVREAFDRNPKCRQRRRLVRSWDAGRAQFRLSARTLASGECRGREEATNDCQVPFCRSRKRRSASQEK